MLSIKKLLLKILQSLMVEEYTFTMPSTVGFSAFKITKCGKIVTIGMTSANKAVVGANNICTLPEGWRPAVLAMCVLVNPTGSLAAGGSNVSLRLTVSTAGVVDLYNYRSTAITSNTNQGGTLTYVAVQ